MKNITCEKISLKIVKVNRIIKVEEFDARRQLAASWRERIVTTHRVLSRLSISVTIGMRICMCMCARVSYI